MASQDYSEYAPDGHGHDQRGTFGGRARQEPSNREVGNQYQAYGQQYSHREYANNHGARYAGIGGADGTPRVHEVGVDQIRGANFYDDRAFPGSHQYIQNGQHLVNGGLMAMAYQQANQIQETLAPYQPQGNETRYDGTWDQSRPAEGSAWPQGRQQNQNDCSNQETVPDRHPPIPQARRSMEFFNLEEPVDTSYDGVKAGAMTQVAGHLQSEGMGEYPAREDDLVSEASIDFEDIDLTEYLNARRGAGTPGWSRFDHAFDQPWTSVAAMNHGQSSNLRTDVDRLTGRMEELLTEDLTDTSQGAASSYVMVDNASSASSFPNTMEENMADSTATLRQPYSQPVIHGDFVNYSDPAGMDPMLHRQGVSHAQSILDLTHLNTL